MNEMIEIRSANENNLKNISVDIPKKKITIITGVSGSGKSSLINQRPHTCDFSRELGRIF